MTARSLDHIVLPTASLDVARERLKKLGFTVAPEGVHPFGTHNACVYLSDGTFLEALAIKSPELVSTALLNGNSFIAGDKKFREIYGDEGLSALVLASEDAKADSVEFERLGIAGGPLVQFARPSLDTSGKVGIASFLLAFAYSEFASGHYFFTCEKQNVPNIDRVALTRHLNGVIAISSIQACSSQSDDLAHFIALFGNSMCTRIADGAYKVALANIDINIVAVETGDVDVMFSEIVFDVSDVAETMSFLGANGIKYIMQDSKLCVPATNGQGADFVFKELP